ncbi:TPA: glycosyltransferase [Streptococcus pneumoniae]
MRNTKRAVVFAGDYAYIRQIETAMKSLCRHNSHLKIYLLNQDIPQEWFSQIRIYLQEMGGDLINNKKWGSETIRQKLIDLTEKEHENVEEGDQSILNMLFKDQYSSLEDQYNFQIGYDYGAAAFKHQFIFDIPLEPLPLILHYISQDKPWNQFSVGRLREVWWEYSLMDWSVILNEWFSKSVKYPSKSQIFKLQCVNLTNSWCVEKIDYLAEQLPEVHFHIVAYTNMANELLALTRFPNVTVYPNSLPMLLEQIVIASDLYLDLNHDRKLEDAYEFVLKYKKPMIAFDNTCSENLSEISYEGIYPSSIPKKMVAAIRSYMR